MRPIILRSAIEGRILPPNSSNAMAIGFWDTIVPNLLNKLIPSTMQNLTPSLAPERDDGWMIFLIPFGLGVMLLWRLMPKGG